MTHRSTATDSPLRLVVIAAALVAAGAAQAAVGPASGSGVLDYGAAGNVFELSPWLYVQGIDANAKPPSEIVTLNPLLSFSSSMISVNPGLMTIDYRLRNNSGVSSFFDLRFMFFANPDGDPVAFMDKLSETWGSAVAGDPVRRAGLDFLSSPSVINSFISSINLPDTYDATCTTGSGCDATVGLQWNAAMIGPGETFHIVVGLSDNGQALSSRWIDATSVSNPTGTTLRLSGMSQIIPVPEPASAWMLVAGLAVLGGAAAKRRARR